MEQLRDREKVAGLLRQVLETYGEELLDDNQKLNALLMDYMPRYDKERKFLVRALELGVGKELIAARRGSAEEKRNALNRCKATLESELLLTESSAKYLVTVIAKALHRETAESPHPRSDIPESKESQPQKSDSSSVPPKPNPQTVPPQPQKMKTPPTVLPTPNPQTAPSSGKKESFHGN